MAEGTALAGVQDGAAGGDGTGGGAPPASGDGGGSGAAGGAGSPPASGSGNSGGQASWRDSLPDDIKADPSISKFSDVPNLAKAYIHAQANLGKKGVIKPDANATPEQWKAFREALGVPSEDKYEIAQPKGFNYPKETIDWAKKTCAKIGLLPEDANAFMAELAQFDTARTSAQAAAAQKATEEGLGKLAQEWGDNYQTELKRGFFAIQQLGELAGVGKDEAVKWINKGAGNDPTFIKLMSAAAKLFKEDSLRENGIGSGSMNEGQILNEISEAQGQLISMAATDPRRPGLLAKVESLYKQKTRGK